MRRTAFIAVSLVDGNTDAYANAHGVRHANWHTDAIIDAIGDRGRHRHADEHRNGDTTRDAQPNGHFDTDSATDRGNIAHSIGDGDPVQHSVGDGGRHGVSHAYVFAYAVAHANAVTIVTRRRVGGAHCCWRRVGHSVQLS